MKHYTLLTLLFLSLLLSACNGGGSEWDFTGTWHSNLTITTEDLVESGLLAGMPEGSEVNSSIEGDYTFKEDGSYDYDATIGIAMNMGVISFDLQAAYEEHGTWELRDDMLITHIEESSTSALDEATQTFINNAGDAAFGKKEGETSQLRIISYNGNTVTLEDQELKGVEVVYTRK